MKDNGQPSKRLEIKDAPPASVELENISDEPREVTQ